MQTSTDLVTRTNPGNEIAAAAAPATMSSANSVSLPFPSPPLSFFRILVKTP